MPRRRRTCRRTILSLPHRLLIGAESCFSGANDCLCPISDLELAKDIRDVILDRLDTQRQYVGDFVITPTLRN